MLKVCIIGHQGRLGLELVEAAQRSGASCRWTYDWREGALARPRAASFEQVALDPEQPDGFVEAMRGCNLVLYDALWGLWALPGPARRGASAGDALRLAVRRARAACAALRAARADRLVVTLSVAALDHVPGSPLVDEAGVCSPAPDQAMSLRAQLLAVEREFLRYAADALDVVLLYPSAPLWSDLLTLPSGLAPQAPINLIQGQALARAHMQAASRASAAQRLILGQLNTTVALAAQAFSSRGQLPWADAQRQALAAQLGWPVSMDAAHRALELRPVASLRELRSPTV